MKRSAAVWLVGLTAMVPSAWHASGGAGRYVDDWAFAAAVQRDGVFSTGEGWSARPGQTFIHVVEFGVLDGRMPLLILLLGIANALASVLLVQLLRPAVGLRTALAVGVVFSVLPNRGSTWLWASTLPSVVSLCLVLALRHVRGWRRGLVLAAAVLTYEGCAALGLGIAVWLAFRDESDTRNRVRSVLLAGGPALAAVAYASAATPKSVGPRPFSGASGVVASHFGIGVWPRPLLGLGLLLVVAGAWSVGTTALPGFRAGHRERLCVLGCIALVLGVLPFVAAGFPMSTDGMLDRANLFGDVGLAMLVVGAVALVAARFGRLQVGATAAVAVVLATGIPTDLRDARRAQRDGDEVLAVFDSCRDSLDPASPVLVQPLPNRGGWGAFGEDGDLSAAFRLGDPLDRPWRARLFVTDDAFDTAAAQTPDQTIIHRGAGAGCG